MDDDRAEPEPALPSLALRGGVGGMLMGLANLVPGISGGTMLLAAGVYPRFIRAIAEVSTLKFRRASLVVLAAVVGAGGIAIVSLAGPVKDFVIGYRWMAYSIFIGLTLGGVPVVWRLIRHRDTTIWIAAVAGVIPMAALGWMQAHPGEGCTMASGGFVMMFLAGVAGASAMILPGVSGGYLLLVLGVYLPILSAIDEIKTALKAGDLGMAMGPGLDVVLPVGLGVVIGVVVVSNGLKWLLARYERATLGFLLGLLIGAVAGLWPFQDGVPPKAGDTFKCKVLTAQDAAEVSPKDYPTEFFSPSATHVLGALGLVFLGFLATVGVARLGREKP